MGKYYTLVDKAKKLYKCSHCEFQGCLTEIYIHKGTSKLDKNHFFDDSVNLYCPSYREYYFKTRKYLQETPICNKSNP